MTALSLVSRNCSLGHEGGARPGDRRRGVQAPHIVDPVELRRDRSLSVQRDSTWPITGRQRAQPCPVLLVPGPIEPVSLAPRVSSPSRTIPSASLFILILFSPMLRLSPGWHFSRKKMPPLARVAGRRVSGSNMTGCLTVPRDRFHINA
jgi:hypothetical protein